MLMDIFFLALLEKLDNPVVIFMITRCLAFFINSIDISAFFNKKFSDFFVAIKCSFM